MKIPNPWRTRSQRLLYDNPWISVREYQVLNPSGQPGIYGKVHFKNIAVGIVPIDERGYTYLVGQYRYTLDEYAWEIPEGGCPLGQETPLHAAQRELLEETGLTAGRWSPLLKLHTSNSTTDEVGYAFVAEDLHLGAAQPDPTEALRLWHLPLEQAIDMALNDRITDALSALALLKIKVLRGI